MEKGKRVSDTSLVRSVVQGDHEVEKVAFAQIRRRMLLKVSPREPAAANMKEDFKLTLPKRDKSK